MPLGGKGAKGTIPCELCISSELIIKNIMIGRNIKLLNEKYCAMLIILLITVIYLFPAFLGKVDTPTDLRDIRMYPWRHYAVDKKLEARTLWNSNLPEKGINVKVPKTETRKAIFNLNLDTETLSKIKNKKDCDFYVNFDFKSEYGNFVAYDLGISFHNPITGELFTPGASIVPLSKTSISNDSSWYKAYFSLNLLLDKLSEINDLNKYKLQIVIKNKSATDFASVYVKDLKILCDDCSKVVKVHNHYNNDLIQMFTPFREYYSNSLKRFKLPFWNNYIFTGCEFISEPQAGYFHPLYLVSYFIFDHFTAHEFVIFISLFLSGLGAFLLARQWQFDFIPSLLTAIVYMFQPFNVTWLSYGHMILNCATLPFLLLFYEKSINSSSLFNKHLIFTALAMGLLFLSGHLQYIHYTTIFFVLFILFKCLTNRGNFFKHLLSSIFILVFGVMIGSIVILQFLPLFQGSHRVANPEDFVKNVSIPFKAFLGLIYPYYGGYPDWPLCGVVNKSVEYDNFRMSFFRNYVYFGFLPFIFSLFSIRTFLKNKLTIFFYLTIIFSLLVSMGTPLYFWIKDFLPGFKEMQHHRFIMLYSYCVPFLAGIGFQIILNFLNRFKFKNVFIVLIILITAVDLIYYSSYFVTWVDRSTYKPLHKNGVLSFIKQKQKESKELFRVLPFVGHKVEGTFLKTDIAEPNTLLPYEIEEVAGYSSFINKDIYYIFYYIQTKAKEKLYSGEIYDLFSNINTPYPISNFHSKILDLLNVKYFIVPHFLSLDSPKVKKIFSDDCAVYENLRAFPRAFIVPSYKVIESAKDTIVELDSETFDARKEVILMTTPGHVIVRSPKGDVAIQNVSCKFARDCHSCTDAPPGRLSRSACNDRLKQSSRVDFLKYEPENIILKVQIEHPGFLVLGHNLNDNWKVKVNGKKGKHIQANLVQRAVYIDKPGEYKIEFYYFSKRFLIGIIVSLFALAVLLIMLKFSRAN